jgi:hypothetical protein
MDSTTAGGLGIFGILISGGGVLYSAINHKKFRFRCCGRDMDASIDIDDNEPKIVKKNSADKIKKAPPPPESDEEVSDESENTMEEAVVKVRAPPPPPPPPRLPPLPPRKKNRGASVAPS